MDRDDVDVDENAGLWNAVFEAAAADRRVRNSAVVFMMIVECSDVFEYSYSVYLISRGTVLYCTGLMIIWWWYGR